MIHPGLEGIAQIIPLVNIVRGEPFKPVRLTMRLK